MYKEVTEEEYYNFILNYNGEVTSKISGGWWEANRRVAFKEMGTYYISLQ